MTYLNQTDITVRLQLTAIYIGSYGSEIANDFFLGKECADEKMRELMILVAYLDILGDYQPVTGIIEESDNCITEIEAQGIFEHISKLIEINFATIGTSYNPV